MSTCNPCEADENGQVDSACCRNRLDQVPWEDRNELICGNDPRRYAYSVAPFGNQFLIHPVLNDETVLLLVYDALKMDFADSDPVPWPEWAAEAVAAYIKWKILLEIDKRPDLAANWYVPAAGNRPAQGVYAMLRLALFREQAEALTANNRDQEYSLDLAPVAPVITGFGAQTVPFLSTITTIQGSGSTALEAVPTVNLTPPLMVRIMVDGVAQMWILQAGTAATSTGVQRPSDYAATTNEKVWVQIS